MTVFTKALAIILAVGVFGTGLIAGIYLKEKREAGSADSDPIARQETPKNTNNSDAESEQPKDVLVKTDETPTNTNTQPQKQEQEPAPQTEIPAACGHVTIEGVWSLATDLEGATFTPPYASESHNFTFNSDGKAQFTENYNAEGVTGTAEHEGTWKREGCNFIYEGVATGSGNDAEIGPFRFTFDIVAGGEISPSDVAIKGDWVSEEVYVSAQGTSRQTVYGAWVAKKISDTL